MNRVEERMEAVKAIAGGRIDQAIEMLQRLQREPRPIQRGVCRFCHCSEASACAILVESHSVGEFSGVILEPTVARCSWADDDATVCTNVSCLERWRREAPAEIDVDVHDVVQAAAPRSRIVLP